jgi:hypothetical protein
MNRDEGLVLEPPPADSIASLGRFRERRSGAKDGSAFGRPLAEWQSESRAMLGLPPDRPVVLTGHQAGIWHAGILAKWIFADSIARRSGAATAAILVEQDTNDAGELAYPALVDGLLRRASLPTLPSRRGGPTGLARPIRVAPPELEPAPGLAPRLAAIAAAVNAEASAANLAAQMAAANDRLLRELLRLEPPPAIAACRLVELPFTKALLDDLASDPRGTAAYAAALAADPRAARPLAPGELPLWRLVPAEPFARREPVRAGDPAPPPGVRLAPRAFLLTAIARLVLGDLFIHGTGGGRYERVTEEWIQRWLGLRLAPMAIASATRRLPLEGFLTGPDPVTPAEIRRRAFDPDARGAGPSEPRRGLLAAIDAAPRGSASRRAAYRALVAHRERRRREIAAELDVLRAELDRSRDRAAALEVARSRTWPWPLHSDARLAELGAELGARPS